MDSDWLDHGHLERSCTDSEATRYADTWQIRIGAETQRGWWYLGGRAVLGLALLTRLVYGKAAGHVPAAFFTYGGLVSPPFGIGTYQFC